MIESNREKKNGRSSDIGKIATTRILTRIISVLSLKEFYSRVDLIKVYGINPNQIKDALNWLIGNGIVERLKVRDGIQYRLTYPYFIQEQERIQRGDAIVHNKHNVSYIQRAERGLVEMGTIIVKNAVQREKGFIYYIDGSGNLCRAKMTHGRKPKVDNEKGSKR